MEARFRLKKKKSPNNEIKRRNNEIQTSRKPRCSVSLEMDCEYIEQYFKCGFTTKEILNLLSVSHGIVLSK